MKISYILIVFIFISFSNQQKYVPKIQVYVESLCPDCMDFIGRSFKKYYETVEKPNLADIEFIPFGNANESYNNDTKKWEFSCQHGENECYGNLIETCIIQLMGRKSSYDAIICIEDNILAYEKDFNKTMDYCFGDDPTLYDQIKECVASDLGNFYQHQMAQKTADHRWVPWIVVDGVHDEDIENQIIADLVNYLCGDDKTKCYNQ